jgi:hypothetical protein
VFGACGRAGLLERVSAGVETAGAASGADRPSQKDRQPRGPMTDTLTQLLEIEKYSRGSSTQ